MKANIELQERAFTLKHRREAFESRIRELEEKEELLNYFTRQNDVSLGVVRAHVPKTKVEEEDLTEFVAEPGKSLNGQTVPNVTILFLKLVL